MVERPDLVRLQVADGVARLMLDRPQRHNSLVPELLEAATLGLVTEVVPADRLDARIAEWLAVLDGHVAAGVRAARLLLLPDERRAAYAAGLEAERRAFLAEVTRPEVRRGMARFLDVRAAG